MSSSKLDFNHAVPLCSRMLFKDLGLKIELGREKREQHMSKGAMPVRGVKCVRMVGRRLRIWVQRVL